MLTLVNSVRLGVRDADPGNYWSAVVMIALITAGLFWGSWRVWRR